MKIPGTILSYHPGELSPQRTNIGYVTEENDLLVFANIGGQQRLGDYISHRRRNRKFIWYGKPQLMKKIINGELALRFFARWDNSKPFFTYLADGKVEKYLDGAEWKPDDAIKFDISIENLNAFANREYNPATTQPVIPSSTKR